MGSPIKDGIQGGSPPGVRRSCVLSNALQWIGDCNCADKAYAECDEPPTGDNIHVTTWQECKAQCDLFASFGACEWFLFDQQQGMDENCHLFSPSRESMTDYLHSCNIVMGPLRNVDGACFAGTCVDTDTVHCPGGCASCAGDKCEFYVFYVKASAQRRETKRRSRITFPVRISA